MVLGNPSADPDDSSREHSRPLCQGCAGDSVGVSPANAPGEAANAAPPAPGGGYTPTWVNPTPKNHPELRAPMETPTARVPTGYVWGRRPRWHQISPSSYVVRPRRRGTIFGYGSPVRCSVPNMGYPHGTALLAADGDHASTVAPHYAAHHKWYRVGSIAPEGDALRVHLSAASVNRLAAAGGAPAGAVGMAISRRCAVASTGCTRPYGRPATTRWGRRWTASSRSSRNSAARRTWRTT